MRGTTEYSIGTFILPVLSNDYSKNSKPRYRIRTIVDPCWDRDQDPEGQTGTWAECDASLIQFSNSEIGLGELQQI